MMRIITSDLIEAVKTDDSTFQNRENLPVLTTTVELLTLLTLVSCAMAKAAGAPKPVNSGDLARWHQEAASFLTEFKL